MRVIRRILDFSYLAGGVLGALFLIAILVIIVMNMGARWFLIPFPGSTDYAGYCMAASSCFTLAYALNKGSHIRVSIVLNALGSRARWILEIWCFAVGAAVAWYVSYFTYRMLGFAIKFKDVSQGQDATPLWIPQMAVLIGIIILAIALTDNLISLLTTGKHRIIRDVTDTQAE